MKEVSTSDLRSAPSRRPILLVAAYIVLWAIVAGVVVTLLILVSPKASKYSGVIGDLETAPRILLVCLPYAAISICLAAAAWYANSALRFYKQISDYQSRIHQVKITKLAIDNYLAVATHYLSIPVSTMKSAVGLLVKQNLITQNLASEISKKLEKLASDAAELLTANQVSNAEDAKAEKVISHVKKVSLKSKEIWIPAFISLVILVISNAVFMSAGYYSKSPYRVAIEFSLLGLAIFLIVLALKYKNYMQATRQQFKEQLEVNSEVYHSRQKFIPRAAKVVDDNYRALYSSSQSITNDTKTRLFFNGLKMLKGMSKGLIELQDFASYDSKQPLFDATSFIQKAIHDRHEQAEELKVTFDAHIGSGLFLLIRTAEIEQLVNSLLDNSLKFSKPGGHIQIQAYKRFGQLNISVSDDGLGIPEDKLPSLMKPFIKGAESMENNFDGIGLSLYANKVIVDKLGGKISIRSQHQEGTVVTISVPIYRKPTSMASALLMPSSTSGAE